MLSYLISLVVILSLISSNLAQNAGQHIVTLSVGVTGTGLVRNPLNGWFAFNNNGHISIAGSAGSVYQNYFAPGAGYTFTLPTIDTNNQLFTPSNAGGTVGPIVMFNLDSGRLQWISTQSYQSNGCTVQGTALFCLSDPGELVILNATTGVQIGTNGFTIPQTTPGNQYSISSYYYATSEVYNVFITSTTENVVYRVALDSTLTHASIVTLTNSAWISPTFTATDIYGHLYVLDASSSNKNVTIIDPNGAQLGSFYACPTTCSGITVDPTGLVYLFVGTNVEVYRGLGEAAFSNPTSSVVGDPIFVGLRGQKYQVHGIDGHVYNLISDTDLLVNARFTFLTSDHKHECPSAPNESIHCWTHPGSYLGAIGIKYRGDTLTVLPGKGAQGWLAVEPTWGEIEQFHIIFNVISQYRLAVQVGNWKLTFQCSDGFINLIGIRVIDWYKLEHAHGLIGQTWRRPEIRAEQVAEVEGAIEDYAEENGNLLGSQFVFGVGF